MYPTVHFGKACGLGHVIIALLFRQTVMQTCRDGLNGPCKKSFAFEKGVGTGIEQKSRFKGTIQVGGRHDKFTQERGTGMFHARDNDVQSSGLPKIVSGQGTRVVWRLS